MCLYPVLGKISVNLSSTSPLTALSIHPHVSLYCAILQWRGCPDSSAARVLGRNSVVLTGDLQSGNEAEEVDLTPAADCYKRQQISKEDGNTQVSHWSVVVSLQLPGPRGNSDRDRGQVHIPVTVFTDVRTHCSDGSTAFLSPGSWLWGSLLNSKVPAAASWFPNFLNGTHGAASLESDPFNSSGPFNSE